tara:strand:- start:636 stop:920 length:285 start_codon:yes stop_codon:yes gene_type:complete
MGWASDTPLGHESRRPTRDEKRGIFPAVEVPELDGTASTTVLHIAAYLRNRRSEARALYHSTPWWKWRMRARLRGSIGEVSDIIDRLTAKLNSL